MARRRCRMPGMPRIAPTAAVVGLVAKGIAVMGIVLTAAAAAGWSRVTHAQPQAPTTGSLQVRARIEPGCRVSDQLTTTSDTSFGSLDFGSAPALFDRPLSAQARGSAGMIELACTGVISAMVAVGTGLHASGTQRRLADSGRHVPYALYADSGFNLPFIGANPRSIAVSPDGRAAVVALPIYGRIEPVSGGYEAGNYSDRVQITVSW